MSLLVGAAPYEYPGGDTAVLMCHGFTGTPQSFGDWGRDLADAGFTVRCPLLPGHGTTWPELNATTWTDWYAEVDRAFGRLRSEGHRVFVAGLSMGGTLALRLAEQHGADVAGLVLVNPSLASARFDVNYLLPVLSRLVASRPGIASDIKQPGRTELAYDRVPLKALASVRRLWAVTRADLGRITCPVLTFRSAEDHIVEPLSGRLLLAGLTVTDVQERVLTDSYHVATLDHDAAAISAESIAWIRAR